MCAETRAVEVFHGLSRAANAVSGSKHHSAAGFYTLRSSLGISLTPDVYLGDTVAPPEIASLKNWDGECVGVCNLCSRGLPAANGPLLACGRAGF